MSSVDFTALGAVLGDYHRAKAPQLIEKQVFAGMQSVRRLGINVEQGVKDEQEFVIPQIGDILQKGGGSWNPTNDAISFIPRRWKVRPYKADIVITPQDFQAKWLAEYLSPSRNPYNFPLAQVMYNMILKKVAENLEQVIWNGVFNPAANPANAANVLAVNNGYKALIADAITALETTPVPTGAITAANAVDSLELMWLSLPDKLQQIPSVIYCSQSVANNYYKNYRALHGDKPGYADLYLNTRNDGNLDVDKVRLMKLDLAGDNCYIMPVGQLTGSGRVIIESRPDGFTSPEMLGPGFLGIGISAEQDLLTMVIEYEKRDMNIMIDGAIGVQIATFRVAGENYVLVNNQV